MASDIISRVHLLNVPLENDYKNTLYFDDITSQQKYFSNNVIREYTNITYQRKDEVIYIPSHIDDISEVNYVMYQNRKKSNKWYYAFVKNMKYENDECTILEIETDVIQTWMFDYEVKPSFVEREHTISDGVGDNTIPENLETGEYVTMQHMSDDYHNQVTMIMGATRGPSDLEYSGAENYNGIPSGMKYYRVDTIEELTQVLKVYSDGYADCINSLFIAPKYLTGENNTGQAYFTPSTAPVTHDLGISKITNLNGYTPRNKKLLTFPYCYIRMSNASGGEAIYHQELWTPDSSGEMKFKIYGVLTPGCSIRGIPLNYKCNGLDLDEGLTLGKYPQLNWTTDQYTNWLTQNGVSLGVTGVGGAAAIIGGIATGNPMMAIGGVTAITSVLTQVHQHSYTPPQSSGNLNSGDVTTAMGGNRFHCYKMGIKPEYARIIDEYFDMFGYKTNRVKVPYKNHRSRWWYTKTIDVNIDGKLPQNDLHKIKECYNNGITFWKNPAEIQNYSLSNGIV